MPTPTTDLHPILQALAEDAGPAARRSKKAKAAAPTAEPFCAEGQLPLNALAVRVHAQPLTWPVTPDAARALHQGSTPAPYGLRDATLLDTRVRDTGEIDADALSLQWAPDAQTALLAELAHALGQEQLALRPHKLLVYAPGQFFKPHQDTEKHPGMVATLVLVCPSAHIGGELRVSHGKQQARFASQHLRAEGLRWFAFYADCRHEVLPVDEGWRVVLTFDVVLPPQPAPVHPPAAPALLAAMRTHFLDDALPLTEPWVFLLDHEYTERGLRWRQLKGQDRPRVIALRAAAEALGLSAHLALAEIHESWTAEYDGYDRYDEESDDEDDGDGDSDDGDMPGRGELIDEDLTLDFWVGADDEPLRRGQWHVSLDDVSSFTETGETFLVDKQYEGYMGNYGETLDYWYRRAALVIQTPLAFESARFTTDFDAALADAVALARSDRTDELAQRLRVAIHSLNAAARAQGRSLLAAYAELAAALPDAEQAQAQAQALCESFDWRQFQPGDAAALSPLAQRWGAPWMQSLVQAWAQPVIEQRSRSWLWAKADEPSPWPQPLLPFIQACQRAAMDADVVAEMLAQCQAALTAPDAAGTSASPAQRQTGLPHRLRCLCELASALHSEPAAAQCAALLRHVSAHPALYPLRQLAPLLHALPGNASAEAQALRAAVMQALAQALAQPLQEADDHRIEGIEWTCHCKDCTPLITWAASPTAEPLTLPLAEQRRQHVQDKLTAAAAPLATETLKRGRPYSLVIRKPADLHQRLRAQRQAWVKDLASLESGTG
ncbi:MAG: 2OG-Fe(II) oxygenase [Pseudomonadota bacterium]|nr:2OG-Fe(II) oxygenase [Pseudomonadota bacterium]